MKMQEFKKNCLEIFKTLETNEDVIINLNAETSLFTRFNHSKIRQNTDVFQSAVDVQFIKNNKTMSFSHPLNDQKDLEKIILKIKGVRSYINTIPDDPYLVHPTNHGESNFVGGDKSFDTNLMIETICECAKEVDLAGILSCGTIIKGNANSKGQFHWFETHNFSLDYSLYNSKQKAVKGLYAGTHFEKKDLVFNLNDSIAKLKMMDVPSRKMEKGNYRVYLSSSAVSELIGILSWGGLSEAYHQRGHGSLTEIWKKNRTLNSKFTITEDFSLGLTPRFNDSGEVFNEKMEIIKNGEYKNFFCSTRTSKEYNVETNYSSDHEAPRSAIISEGTVDLKDILKTLDTGIYVSDLHYLNWSDREASRATGMTRYACFYVEKGKIVCPIEDLRFDDSFYHIFGDGLIDLTNVSELIPNTGSYFNRQLGGMKVPGIFVSDFKFTL